MAHPPRYFEQTYGPVGPQGERGVKGTPDGDRAQWRMYLMGDHPNAIPGETYSDPSVGDGWLAMGDVYARALSDANKNTGLGTAVPGPFPAEVSESTAVGYSALNGLTTGYRNTAFGVYALSSVTTGNYNVGLGPYALRFNRSGTDLVAIGHQTLFNTVDGVGLTAVGCYGLMNNTTGRDNTALGDRAGYYNSTGSNNTFLGNQSGLAVTTGASNTLVGYLSGYNHLSTQGQHVNVGMMSGPFSAATGNFATSLGYGAKSHTTATAVGGLSEARGVNSTAIGYGAIATLNNQIMLGGASDRVYVNNSPINPLEVATKSYVDGKVGGVVSVNGEPGPAVVLDAADVGATTKSYVDARTPKITVATTAPSSPAVNDIWVNSA